ncbi:MAG: MBL fold metallo-hydrolase [Longimicrobiales bacterium]
MPIHVCVTCGTAFPPSTTPPEACPICLDERQYVPPAGQGWTTSEELAASHANRIERLEDNLYGIGTEPDFAIAQRALLIQTPQGNVLWDCISLLDEDTRAAVEGLGGIDAIAISHPHYYGNMVAWAHAFDAPIHLHAAERAWVMDPDPMIRFWEDDSPDLPGGLSLIRLGGHFEGGQVLHWPQGAEGRGALLAGDIVQVAADRRWVSFMYSYPNYIPLPASQVRHMGRALANLSFERLYGAWWDKVVEADAHAAVQRSVARYLDALDGCFSATRGGVLPAGASVG